jgi:hypothetical protein
MRPTRFLLFLVALLLLAPVSALAGKGGGGGTGVVLDDPVEGDYFFVDKISFDRLKSLASVDQKANEICVNGIATFVDTTTTLNRRVEVEFISTGTIEKQGPGKVDGLFTSVDLTFNVWNAPENQPPFVVIFTSTVLDAPCVFDAKLGKIGLDQGKEPEVDDDELIGQLKADLVCDLGPDLSVLGKVPEGILDSIGVALDKKKSIKIRINTGDFQVNHKGERVDPVETGLDFSMLSCDPAPPPPPPE